MNYKAVIQYEGTRYRGWQIQGNTEHTIQGKLEALLSRMEGAPVEVHGSGRTDAGVHAAGQVISFRCSRGGSAEAIRDYMNRYLPEDMAVLSVEDAELMQKAADCLCGTNDYRAFCSLKRLKKSTVRTVEEIRVRREGPLIEITYTGDGFLYHMVRIMTGTLVEAGLGLRSAESMKEILESRDRPCAGRLMPPEGLMLMNVDYGTES